MTSMVSGAKPHYYFFFKALGHLALWLSNFDFATHLPSLATMLGILLVSVQTEPIRTRELCGHCFSDCIHLGVCVFEPKRVEVRGKLAGLGSLFPTLESKEAKAGCQAWQ